MNSKIKDLALNAIIAALYVVVTLLTSFMSYGGIQFRIAEILVLLCFYDKKYNKALILGCIVSNLFSPFGIYDVIFGTLATFLSIICMNRIKKISIASLCPVIFNGIIIAIEICIFDNIINLQEFLILALGIMFGEFVVVSLVGVPVFKVLERQEKFQKALNVK